MICLESVTGCVCCNLDKVNEPCMKYPMSKRGLPSSDLQTCIVYIISRKVRMLLGYEAFQCLVGEGAITIHTIYIGMICPWSL